MNSGEPTDAREVASLLPPVPPARELPHRAAHRAALLAVLAAEPAPARMPLRRGPAAVPRWLLAAAAAVAVCLIAALALAVPRLIGATPLVVPISHSAHPGRTPGGWTWLVPLTGLRAVAVHTNAGSVTVTAALATGYTVLSGSAGSSRLAPGTDSVAVRVTRSYHGTKPAIFYQVSHGVLTISGRCLASSGASCRVSFFVVLPRAMPVAASSQLGTVQVTGMTGPVQVHAALGTISLLDLQGPVSASDELGQIDGSDLTSQRVALTADLGAIDLAFRTPPMSVVATDQDGSVLIRVPTTTSYAVTTTVSLGGVKVSVPVSDSSPHVITATSELGSVTITG